MPDADDRDPLTVVGPRVRVIGVQRVDRPELADFLGEADSRWAPQIGVSDSETLVEVAGRVCYMSFAAPRPGGTEAYIRHIKEVGHGCFDAETDVLTLAGWRPWPEVTEADRLATLNPATGKVEYHKPLRLVRYVYTGRMYRVDSHQVDLLVTPDHRMYACPTTTKEGRKKRDYVLVKAAELQHVSHAYLKSGDWGGGWWQNCPGRDVFALLGFAIGDGYMSRLGSGSVRFRLRRERKIAWLKALCKRLGSLGFVLEEADGDRFTVRLPAGDRENGLVSHLFSGIYGEDGEKQIPWSESVFSGASRDGLEGLFEGLMQSDGHEGTTGDSFDTTSPHLPGQFQQLCLHLGLAANVCYTYGPEQRPSSFGEKPLTRLSVIRRCLRPEVNKWAGCDGKTSWVEDWHGEVFCAEVPNNILYVRRNGKPVWSGNSVLEHAVFTFLLTGVSRSLTHELVRHRAGWSYSMLSQRYVDESAAEYVEPGVIAADPELHEIWEEAIQSAHAAYVRLAGRLAEKFADRLSRAAAFLPPGASATDIRKAARSAARSVLPNATETKVAVTVNARALRHFFELRADRPAEWEIRRLANLMHEAVAPGYPHLFGDYAVDNLPDGTYVLSTQHPKV